MGKVKALHKVEPAKPFVAVVLRGVEYKLCFTYGALAAGEYELHRAGYFPELFLLNAWPNLLETVVLQFLFACSLQTYHSDLAFEDAMALLDEVTHSVILRAVLQARGVSFPKPDPQDPTQPVP